MHIDPPVLAALITAIASLVVTAAGGFYFSVKIENERAANAKKIEEMKADALKDFETYKRELDEKLKARHERREELKILLNAASIAYSAADTILATASLHPEEHHEAFHRTTSSLQQLSAFVGQVKEATLNVNLTREDLDMALKYQFHIMRLFFALDLDAGGTEEYKAKLKRCFDEVSKSFDRFKDHCLELREKGLRISG